MWGLRRPSRAFSGAGWLALAVMIASVAPMASGGEVLFIASHSFEFQGVTYNDDGTSTWAYRAVSGWHPSLSHWVLGFDSSILGRSNVVSCSERYEVNTDPTTGVYGLKFSGGYRDHESRDVTFTLDAWYSVVPTLVGAKAGKYAATGSPLPGPGPEMTPENAPPVASDDLASTGENGSVRIDVLQNDRDDDGTLNRTTVTLTELPIQGSASVDPADGTVTYAPAPATCGDDTFRYQVSDDDGATSNEAEVTVSVVCNEPPAADDDSATTDENTAIAINVVANDRDSDGTLDLRSVSISTYPEAGSVSVHPATGVVTYTPIIGACGDNVFEYTIRDDDGATSSPARVTVTVLCNDPPLAIDDLYNVSEGATLDVPPVGVLANDIDSPGSPLLAVLVSGVAHGVLTLHSDGSFVYVHNGSETRDDAFTYKANDTFKDSNAATVNLVIAPTNDVPMAADDEAATQEDEPVTIDVLSNDSDPDGDSLSVNWTSPPAHGRVSNLGSAVEYSPDSDFHGVDAFNYAVSDGRGGTSSATVTIAVSATNDNPQAQDDSVATPEDVSVAISVLSNDSDPEGDPLAIQALTQPENGSVESDGTLATYTPNADFHGVDTFTYTVADGLGGTSTAVVTVVVSPINDPPMARGGIVFTDEDVALSIAVLANDTDPDGDSLALDSVAQPAHGSVSTSGTTAIYTPTNGFHGEDAFTYTVSDGHGGAASATITIVVASVNDAPVAQDDVASTDEDVAVTVNALANDSDADGNALTIAAVTQPANGETRTNGTDITYVPSADVHGVDMFEYTISDGLGGTAGAVVTITVAAVNDGPAARDDVVATDEDTPVAISVLANDMDPDGDILSIQSIVQPTSGAVVKAGDALTYTPNSDFHGVDAFKYTASDGHGGTSSATVTVTLAAVNDDPQAQPDSASTEEETAVTVSVLANDSDPDGDALSIESVTGPGDGSAEQVGASVIYTPNTDFRGVDTFAYTVSDGLGGTASAVITIAVAAVNDAPVARDDAAATDEDAAVAIAVLANDSDPDGDTLVIESVTQPGNGGATKSGETVTYAPRRDYHGRDSFSYTASDGHGGTSSAAVTVTIAAANDAPLAQDDSAVTDEDTAVTIPVLANDSDPDGDPLAIQVISSPVDGSAEIRGTTVVYTPAAGFHGVDTFTYVAADDQGGRATARVTVNVATVNHPPLVFGGTVEIDEDTSVTISVLANDVDPDGDTLTLLSVTQSGFGTVVRSGADVTYRPNSGYHGADSFMYTASDGRGGTASAAITITVVEVNDVPLARDDSASATEDGSVDIGVLGNDTDPDGDVLALQSVSSPAHGSAEVNGSVVTYVPALGFHGADNFTYVVTDGRGGSASAAVSVDVASVNDLPSAANDAVSTLEDTPVTILVLANDVDPDGDSLAIESNSQPLHGTTVRSGSSIVYSPTLNYFGSDAFTYTASDGEGGSAVATVTVTVVAANDLPVAQDDSAVTDEDVAVSIAVLGNDHDPDGDGLTIQSVTQPSHGVVSNAKGELTYAPAGGFSGADVFTYTVSDGRGGSDTARVSVAVSHVNHSPIAQDDSAIGTEGAMLTIAVLQNDSDPDGDFLLVQSIETPANGTVLNGRTSVSYIPNAGFHGVDMFTYAVSDGNGGVGGATVTVSVAAANQAPRARDDSGITDEDAAVTVQVLGNDLDPDGDALRVESIAQPSAGTAVLSSEAITYTPAAGWSGVDLFTYTASDGRGGTATASVMMVVVAANDAPTAQDDSATTDRDVSIAVPVLGNDGDEDGDALAVVSVTHGVHGIVVNQGTGVVYTPDEGFVGTDSFTYTVADLRGESATATVTVGVQGVAGAGGALSQASCEGRVIISEIAWAGTAASAEDEWIELQNLGTTSVDLTGWTLQWRRTRPVAAGDYVWKTVDLSGTLAGSAAAACDGGAAEETPRVLVSTEDASGLLWRVSYDPSQDAQGYFLLERTREDAVDGLTADMLYDATRSPLLALSNLGEVVMLVNGRGDVVDTANASSVGRDEWAAGSAGSFGSMERIDPLGPDVVDNWGTNMGVVTRGQDAQRHPLRATPGAPNAPLLEALYEATGETPVALRAGSPLGVSLSLSREDRKTAGWPWIIETQPGLDLATGEGGSLEQSGCSFSGRAKTGDEYALDIGTAGAPPGVHLFWIVYGRGEALLMPVVITP